MRLECVVVCAMRSGTTGRAYVEAIERYAREQEVPLVRFRKGESKEEAVRPYLERAARERASAA